MRPLDSARQSTQHLQQLRLISKLQSGVSGTIFEAEHIPTNSLVAVKRILLDSPSTAARFLAECKHSSGFSTHPNVVDTYYSFTHEAYGYIVMELLPNDLLEQFDDFRNEENLRTVFQQVCKAVASLHNNNIERVLYIEFKARECFHPMYLLVI